MEVVITINEKDLVKNPSILDMVKGFARSLESPKTDSVAAEPVKESVAEATADTADTSSAEPAEEQATQEEPAEAQPAEPMAEEGAEITISIEEVRAAIAKVGKKHGAATAKKILQNYGAENLSGLDEKFYASALEEAKAVL